jgi:hypothetical protein
MPPMRRCGGGGGGGGGRGDRAGEGAEVTEALVVLQCRRQARVQHLLAAVRGQPQLVCTGARSGPELGRVLALVVLRASQPHKLQ